MKRVEPLDLWLARALQSQHEMALQEPPPEHLLRLIAETERKR